MPPLPNGNDEREAAAASQNTGLQAVADAMPPAESITLEAESTAQVKPAAGQNPALARDLLIADGVALCQFRQMVHGFVSSHKDERIAQDISKDEQATAEQLLAKYVGLYQSLSHQDNVQYSGMALIGLKALHSGRVEMASAIFDDVRYYTSSSAALVYVMRGVWSFIRYFTSLISAIFLLLYVAPLCFDLTGFGAMTAVRGAIEGEAGKVILAGISGCFGGVVSLLLRLSEFETMRRRSREFLTLTGATLPVVGGISAAVIGAIFSADLVNVTAGGGSAAGMNAWLFLVLGFLSGFSERFTRNVFHVAQERLGAAGNAQGAAQSEIINSKRLAVDMKMKPAAGR